MNKPRTISINITTETEEVLEPLVNPSPPAPAEPARSGRPGRHFANARRRDAAAAKRAQRADLEAEYDRLQGEALNVEWRLFLLTGGLRARRGRHVRLEQVDEVCTV